jgi:radical SAM superfamily enzyme YgiQ (UPF0313 family)
VQSVEVRILDGNHHVAPAIRRAIKEFQPDFFGLTDWFSNHKNCIELARYVKSACPETRVAFGGPNAGHLARQILRNHSEVDYVVANDGENAILNLIRGTRTEHIPNLFYRRSPDEIAFTFAQHTDLNSIPMFHCDFVGLTESLRPYDCRSAGYRPEYLTPFPVSSIRGCIKAVTSGRCAYCSIPGDKIQLVSPDRFWRQIIALRERYGIEYFFETGDDFVVGTYPERLLRAKPSGLRVRFRVYTQPSSVTPATLKTLANLGVSDIFIGTENVDPSILEKSGKPYDTKRIPSMMRLLGDFGIRPHLTFLFGLPGETLQSASLNASYALSIATEYRHLIKRLLFSLAVPIVGSAWYDRLRADPNVTRHYELLTGRALASDDTPDYQLLADLATQRDCQIDLTTLNTLVVETTTRLAAILGETRLTTFGALTTSRDSTSYPELYGTSYVNVQHLTRR